jgi:hypothetical protein
VVARRWGGQQLVGNQSIYFVFARPAPHQFRYVLDLAPSEIQVA